MSQCSQWNLFPFLCVVQLWFWRSAVVQEWCLHFWHQWLDLQLYICEWSSLETYSFCSAANVYYCVSLPSSCTDVNPAAAQCTATTSSSNKVSLQPVITSLVSFHFLLSCLWSYRILVLINCVTMWSRQEHCVVSSKWWVQVVSLTLFTHFILMTGSEPLGPFILKIG